MGRRGPHERPSRGVGQSPRRVELESPHGRVRHQDPLSAVRRPDGDAGSRGRCRADARSVLGLPAVRAPFLDDVSPSKERRSQARGSAGRALRLSRQLSLGTIALSCARFLTSGGEVPTLQVSSCGPRPAGVSTSPGWLSESVSVPSRVGRRIMEQPFWRLESEGRLPNGQHGVTLHWRPLRRGRAAGLEVGSGRGNSEGRRRLVLAFENGPRTSRPCFPAQLSIEVLGIRPQDVRFAHRRTYVDRYYRSPPHRQGLRLHP